jgi:hypothetical protein
MTKIEISILHIQMFIALMKFLVIYTESRTWGIGLYDTEKEAQNALLRFLFKHGPKNKVFASLEKTHNVVLKGKSVDELVALLFSKEALADDFRDEVNFFIDRVTNKGEIYDFTQIGEWNMDNLYELLQNVQSGDEGDFCWPPKHKVRDHEDCLTRPW